MRRPTSSTPAAACALAASNRLPIVGFPPSDARVPRAAARGPVPLGRPDTVADLVGRFDAEGKRVPSIFLRKGEGTSSSSYDASVGTAEGGRTLGAVRARAGPGGCCCCWAREAIGRGEGDFGGSRVGGRERFVGLVTVSLRRPNSLVKLIGDDSPEEMARDGVDTKPPGPARSCIDLEARRRRSELGALDLMGVSWSSDMRDEVEERRGKGRPEELLQGYEMSASHTASRG